MTGPKVSVILPTYKGENYLEETIDAILNQTFVDFEVVVVFQEGGDRTMEILSSYDDPRIRIVETTPGYPHCMNIGLDHALGEYIAVQDDDDIPTLDRLEKQSRYLDEQPDVIAVTSSVRLIDGDGNDLGILTCLKDTNKMSSFEYLYSIDFFSANGSLMFRRGPIDEGLRYDEEIFAASDNLFTLQLYHGRKAYHFKEPLLYIRRNVDSLMTNKSIRDRFESVKEIRKRIRKKYDLPLRLYMRARSSDYFHMCGEYWVSGRRSSSLKCLCLAVAWYPINWRIYRGVFGFMTGIRDPLPSASLEASN